MVDIVMSTMGDRGSSILVDMDTLADRVKNERAAIGITQDQLGEDVGVTKQAISKIESAQTKNPELSTFFRLCDRFGVRPRWLGLGEKPRTDDPESQLSRSDWATLADAATQVAARDGDVSVDALVEAFEHLRKMRGGISAKVSNISESSKIGGKHGANAAGSSGAEQNSGRAGHSKPAKKSAR